MKQSPIQKYAVKETKVRLRHLKKNLRHTAKHADDPDAIHDLRVSIRRLTQCFRTFRELLDPPPIKKLRRRLHKVMERCADVRNCDIALDTLRAVDISGDPTASKLKEDRAKAENRLHSYLKRKRSKYRTAVSTSPRPAVRDWKLDQSPEENLRRVLPALAETFFRAGAAAAVPGVSPRTLHQFRLRAKRFRYTLEIFEPFYGPEMIRGAEALKTVQDRLGAINDCAATIDLLRGDADSRALAAIRGLMDERRVDFQDCWRKQFPPQKLAWWKGWLSRPSIRDRAA